MAALVAVLVQQAGDNGVLLRPLEHGGGVRLVQTRAAALLRRRQAIGLARAAYAAALSLIHISEPTRLGMISYAGFCLKKKKK